MRERSTVGGGCAEDEALKVELRASREKIRRKNLMITDLLRNDFAVFQKIGSVRVPPCQIEQANATRHQMISEGDATDLHELQH